jgi:hypothetical protein
MPLISASGNVFSRPTRTPTRFMSVNVLSRKPRQNTRARGLVKQASGELPDSIHANAIEVRRRFLQGMCYNSASMFAFPGWRRRLTAIWIQGERLHFAALVLALIALGCVLILFGIDDHDRRGFTGTKIRIQRRQALSGHQKKRLATRNNRPKNRTRMEDAKLHSRAGC